MTTTTTTTNNKMAHVLICDSAVTKKAWLFSHHVTTYTMRVSQQRKAHNLQPTNDDVTLSAPAYQMCPETSATGLVHQGNLRWLCC